jgi:hypothetical protein
MFDTFVSPSKKYADVIIPWAQGENSVAIDLIVQHIRTKLGRVRTYSFFHFSPSWLALFSHTDTHFSPRYFAVKTLIDDSQCGPCNQSI